MAEKTIAPGMQSVIEAGETWEIEDANKQTFEIRAVEHNKTMDFLKAFDAWHDAREHNITGPIIDVLWANLTAGFMALPAHVLREMPSINALGVRVTSHEH